MKKTLFFAILSFLFCGILLAQKRESYPLVAKGKLPEDFVTRSSDKYEMDKQNLGKREKDKKVKKGALLASNFEIDDMLLSGSVLFNDTLQDYVNKVADKLLENDRSGLRRKLRFYTFKSPSVNAFATQQGMIFINVGLLAYLNNEAEFALVLSHEIQHYVLKHVITAAVENHKIKKGKGSYKRLEGKRAKTAARCLFSREQETQADGKGFELFKKSNYAADSVFTLFDVLKYCYLPFRQDSFSKTFFENQYYKIPDSYIVTATSPIDTADDNDDKKSTHPSLPKRKKAMLEAIAKLGAQPDKRVYLVGENEFKTAQRIARHESAALSMLNHDYERCLYISWLLLKEEPNNFDLQKMVLHSLTALGVYSANGSFHSLHDNADEIEGKQQTLYYLFEKMDSVSKIELPILALSYGAKLLSKYPKNGDVFADMKAIGAALSLHGINADYFNDVNTMNDTAARESTLPKTVLSEEDKKTVLKKEDKKPKKSKRKSAEKEKQEDNEEDDNDRRVGLFGHTFTKKDETVRVGNDYTRNAIVEYKNEPWLKNIFEVKQDSSVTASMEDDEFEGKKGRRKANSQTEALGLTKVLVVNPDYIRINEEMEDPIRYLRGEKGRVDFSERIKSNARVAKLDLELLDSHDLRWTDVDKLNDIALLQDYLRDQNMHGDINVPFPYKGKMNRLMKKYDCRHVLWTGVISYQEKFKRRTGLAIGSAVCPIILPFTLPTLVNRGFWTYYYNLVFDLKEDEAVFANFREINNRSAGYILNSHIYDTFYQLKHKK